MLQSTLNSPTTDAEAADDSTDMEKVKDEALADEEDDGDRGDQTLGNPKMEEVELASDDEEEDAEGKSKSERRLDIFEKMSS